jgi:hypothetical protein
MQELYQTEKELAEGNESELRNSSTDPLGLAVVKSSHLLPCFL